MFSPLLSQFLAGGFLLSVPDIELQSSVAPSGLMAVGPVEPVEPVPQIVTTVAHLSPGGVITPWFSPLSRGKTVGRTVRGDDCVWRAG